MDALELSLAQVRALVAGHLEAEEGRDQRLIGRLAAALGGGGAGDAGGDGSGGIPDVGEAAAMLGVRAR